MRWGIPEGYFDRERRTTLNEVVVLCKNHHAQAHHDMKMAAFFKAENEENPMPS
jgi:hypothetical protein